MSDRFFVNLHFNEILHLLITLHVSIKTIGDDSAEAESVRDELDAQFRFATREEIQAANDFSAFLYSMDEKYDPS